MSQSAPHPPEVHVPDRHARPLEITVEGSRVLISDFEVDDPVLAGLLAKGDEPGRLLERIISVGARGLATMGLSFDISEVDVRVNRTVERVTDEAAVRVRAMLDEAHRVLSSSLDPEQRSSMVARTVADFGAWRDSFLDQVDPDTSTSHTGRLLDHLRSLLGPGGALDQRLDAALDPSSDDSGLGRVSILIEERFAELREAMAIDRGRKEEAERGTAKGFDFEDQVEDALREIARPLGAIVERTSRSAGALAGEAVVGDFVVEIPDLGRVVVEAKNVRSLALTGKDSILGQLDRAMANRDASVGVCVSAQDAFPREVGPFGTYGNRLLVVDDGEGTMLQVAVRWAIDALRSRLDAGSEVDVNLIEERLQRVRMLAQRFSSNRRALTEISSSVDKVRDSLEDMRRDMLELVEDASVELRRPTRAEVVDLNRRSRAG